MRQLRYLPPLGSASVNQNRSRFSNADAEVCSHSWRDLFQGKKICFRLLQLCLSSGFFLLSSFLFYCMKLLQLCIDDLLPCRVGSAPEQGSCFEKASVLGHESNSTE